MSDRKGPQILESVGKSVVSGPGEVVLAFSEEGEGCLGWLFDQAAELCFDVPPRILRGVSVRFHEHGILDASGDGIDVYLVGLGLESLLLVERGAHECSVQQGVVQVISADLPGGEEGGFELEGELPQVVYEHRGGHFPEKVDGLFPQIGGWRLRY